MRNPRFVTLTRPIQVGDHVLAEARVDGRDTPIQGQVVARRTGHVTIQPLNPLSPTLVVSASEIRLVYAAS